MPIALLELLHNLSDRDWEYCTDYKIDKNEAEKIVTALENLKYEMIRLKEEARRGNKGRWIPIVNVVDWYHCSICGCTKAQESRFCSRCGARMESD